MRTEIIQGLWTLAQEEQVTTMLAVESGSRAWGVQSPDSDYDVRFIYRHKPEWYMDLHEQRDVIEHMTSDGVLDFAGWDLRKALRLAYKSNPSLLEWLSADTVYSVSKEIVGLREIMKTFSARALMYHYVGLAYRQRNQYWLENRHVKLKKYFYALRPLMAVQFMHDHGYAIPPLRFNTLRAASSFSSEIDAELDDLLARKAATMETGAGRYPALDIYIDDMIARGHQWVLAAPDNKPDMGALNEYFIQTIGK